MSGMLNLVMEEKCMSDMITIFKDKKPSLEEAQAIVGGYVQIVIDDGNIQLLVNEEGLLKNLELNKQASLMAGQTLVGPAIILKGDAMWNDEWAGWGS